MLTVIQSANLALRFLLELCALAALGYWGFHTGPNLPIKIVLAVSVPFTTVLIARAALFRKRQEGANIPPPLSRN